MGDREERSTGDEYEQQRAVVDEVRESANEDVVGPLPGVAGAGGAGGGDGGVLPDSPPDPTIGPD